MKKQFQILLVCIGIFTIQNNTIYAQVYMPTPSLSPNLNVGIGESNPVNMLHITNLSPSTFNNTTPLPTNQIRLESQCFSGEGNGNGNPWTIGQTLVNVSKFDLSVSCNSNSFDITYTGTPLKHLWSFTPDKTYAAVPDFQVANIFRVSNIFWTNTDNLDIDADGLRIKDASGNIQFKVNTSGYMRVRDVQVDLQTIPDYVFNKDYQLMPLNEVEKYVNEYQHLPNIPSEKEYKERAGIDIGELNMKLLEKVEELTLYILSQEKRILELEKKLK